LLLSPGGNIWTDPGSRGGFGYIGATTVAKTKPLTPDRVEVAISPKMGLQVRTPAPTHFAGHFHFPPLAIFG